MTNKLFFLLLSLLTVLTACKDSETFNPEPGEKAFKASAFVEIVDILGNPVPDVEISIRHVVNSDVVTNTYGATNAEGLLQLKNVDMYSSTYLTATKSGYFLGSRRFYPVKDKTQFVQIMLMEKQYAGSFWGSPGGIVQLNDQVSLNFPYVGVVDATGADYEGEVRVMVQAISADDENLSTKMPGDLVGINESNVKGALGSMGMVAVELVTPAGAPVKMKEGSKAMMKLKVPNDKMSSAPATIDMWYFDEDLGYWIQEGTADLVGNEYVAELPHFSFWNCDAWFDLVKWGASFVYENGDPASQVNVCLHIISMNSGACGITNEDGLVCGSVAANELMVMEVRTPCGEVIYSQEVGPYTVETMIGPITIPGSSVSQTAVSGTAVDCNGDPVTNGYATIKVGASKRYVALDETTGEFNLTVMNCNESDIQITVYDLEGLKQSLPMTFGFTTLLDAGTITVCEELTELIDLEIVGLPDHYFFYFPDVYIQQNTTTIYTADSTVNNQYFYVRVNATTPGTYVADGSEVGFNLPNGDRAVGTGLTVTFTYFGDVGDYITGTLSGILHTGPNGQGGPDYPLLGTFTVLRE